MTEQSPLIVNRPAGPARSALSSVAAAAARRVQSRDQAGVRTTSCTDCGHSAVLLPDRERALCLHCSGITSGQAEE